MSRATPDLLLWAEEKPPSFNGNPPIANVIAFATSDFPSVLQGFLHTEQHYIRTATQNAHNIGIFLAPAYSKPVHIRRSDRSAGGAIVG